MLPPSDAKKIVKNGTIWAFWFDDLGRVFACKSEDCQKTWSKPILVPSFSRGELK